MSKYYFAYAFQSENGFGFGYSNITIKGKITADTLIEVQEYLFEQNKELVINSPIILNWKKLEEEDEI